MAIPDSVTIDEELTPDAHKQSIIQSYIEEFRSKGCVNTVIRLLRETLPEHMYIHLINAVDKEGSILTVLLNAIRLYLASMYIAPTVSGAQPAPPQQQPAQSQAQQPQDLQSAIVQQVVSKVLEKQLSRDESEDAGGMFDLRSMIRQMMAMAFMPMMQQMMQNIQASMMRMAMPGMALQMPAVQQQAQQVSQQVPPQDSQPGQQNVRRIDIL